MVYIIGLRFESVDFPFLFNIPETYRNLYIIILRLSVYPIDLVKRKGFRKPISISRQSIYLRSSLLHFHPPKKFILNNRN